jgi:hypothetical protein
MRKILLFCIAVLLFSSCATTIKKYGLENQSYPEWMLNYEFGRNYLGLQYGVHKKHLYEYDSNNFFIENMATAGSNDCELRLLINPAIEFEYLNIIEISFIKDGEKVYIIKDKRIKNEGYRYTQLPDIKYYNYNEYFKNMEIGEIINITIFQKYQFDDGLIITEEAPYRFYCFEDEFHPLGKLTYMFYF